MTFFINIFRGFVLSVILEQRQWYWLRAVCGWLWCVFQMKKAKKLIRIFFYVACSSGFEMTSEVSLNINTSLMPLHQPGCELSGIFGKQTPAWKMAKCLKSLCSMSSLLYERSRHFFFFLISSTSALPQTPPFIWSFKIHKLWLGDYFYTHCL